MVLNQRRTGLATSMPMGIATGWFFSIVTTVAFSLIQAICILKEVYPQQSIGYGNILILILSTVSGASLAMQRIKHRKLMVSMILGITYFVSLLITNALFFGGQYTGVGYTLVTILVSAFAAGMLNLKGVRNKNKKRKKWHNG